MTKSGEWIYQLHKKQISIADGDNFYKTHALPSGDLVTHEVAKVAIFGHELVHAYHAMKDSKRYTDMSLTPCDHSMDIGFPNIEERWTVTGIKNEDAYTALKVSKFCESVFSYAISGSIPISYEGVVIFEESPILPHTFAALITGFEHQIIDPSWINIPGEIGRDKAMRPLTSAIKGTYPENALLLLEQPTLEVSYRDSNGSSPLRQAIKDKKYLIAEQIASHPNFYGETTFLMIEDLLKMEGSCPFNLIRTLICDPTLEVDKNLLRVGKNWSAKISSRGCSEEEFLAFETLLEKCERNGMPIKTSFSFSIIKVARWATITFSFEGSDNNIFGYNT